MKRLQHLLIALCVALGAGGCSVREYALRGQNIPLTGGRLLQAAMGLMVVAAEERDAE